MGVRDSKLQARLIDKTYSSFEEAVEEALKLEMLLSEVPNLQNSGNVHAVKTRGNLKKKNNNNNYQNRESPSSTKGQKGKGERGKPQCFYCKRYGHIAKYCFKRKNNNNASNYINANTNKNKIFSRDDENNLGYINNFVFSEDANPLVKEFECNGKLIKFEIDSEACATVMHDKDFYKNFPNLKLKQANKKLNVVSGNMIETEGVINLKVVHNNRCYNLDLYVIKSNKQFMPLLGRTWLNNLFPDWKNRFQCNKVDFESCKIVEEFTRLFPKVFSKNCKDPIAEFKASIILEKDSPNIFCKPYVVPFGLREVVENELNKLVTDNIIYPVKYSNYASSIVVVKKSEDKIRICADFKVSLNRYVVMDHSPLHRIDDILVGLAGCTHYCVLDLQGAYQQLEIEEECQEYLTINTHIGLFRYKRLIYGLKSAPAIFQSIIDQILLGMNLVKSYLDDIIIGGKNLMDCKKNLIEVLKRLENTM